MSGSPYLSAAWFEHLRAAAADLPVEPGATGRVAHLVTGGPDGDVAYVVAFLDGRLVEADLTDGSDAPDAAVSTVRSHADGVRIAAGELDEAAAFMQGRLKVTGDMGTWMAIQPVTQGPAWQAVLAEMATATAPA